jgi:hypothetical protein
MLPSAFRQQLGCRVEPRRCCLGRFDEHGVSLAVATGGNRVLLRGFGTWSQERFLNLNREVSCLASGRLDPGMAHDLLLVGSPSSLLAYDVHNNADNFFVDVPEGVRTVTCGVLAGVSGKPLAFVGGYSSLQGFSAGGTEAYWTVIGGNASCLAFCDVDGDGAPELLVGSDDFELRAFKTEESSLEVTETEAVVQLCPLGGSGSPRFAYGLANGTVGVYHGSTRVWRVKSKDSVNALQAFDLDGDGVDELVSGWSNGKLEVRRAEDGSVVYRETFQSPVVALLRGPFRGGDKDELVVCLADGEVRGYSVACADSILAPGAASGGVAVEAAFGGHQQLPVQQQQQQQQQPQHQERRQPDVEEPAGYAAAVRDPFKSRSVLVGDAALPQEAAHAQHHGFERRDAALAKAQEQLSLKMMELRSLEERLRRPAGSVTRALGALPAGTKVALSVRINAELKCLELLAEASTDCLVQSVLVLDLDAGVFPHECVVGSSGSGKNLGRNVVVALPLVKHERATLRVQTLVAARGAAENLHVFEDQISLPRFATFCALPVGAPLPVDKDTGAATFHFPATSLAPLADALVELFGAQTLTRDRLLAGGISLQAALTGLGHATGRVVVVDARLDARQTCVVRLRSDTLELASSLVQELAERLALDHLECEADFPREMRHLEGLMASVTELTDIRQRLGAEIADEANYIKALIVKAEDARVLDNCPALAATYQELTTLNLQLIGEYNKRANNQARLLNSLKEVNSIIQLGSRLRVGKPQAAVVASSRKAIKTNNLPALFHALTSSSIGT